VNLDQLFVITGVPNRIYPDLDLSFEIHELRSYLHNDPGAESELQVGAGCGPISGLHTQVFYTIRSNDFFPSSSTFVLLTV